MSTTDSGSGLHDFFDRSHWPRYGRAAIGQKGSERFQTPPGQMFLIIPEVGDLWMIYEAGPDGADPRSDLISKAALADFCHELDLKFLPAGPEEDELEARVFGLRSYWKRHNRY